MPKRSKDNSETSDSSDSNFERKRKKLRKELDKLEQKQRRRKKRRISSESSSQSQCKSAESENASVYAANIKVTEDLDGNSSKTSVQDPEIMKLLGEEPPGSDEIFGSEVHQALADRWSKFLTLGVEKSEKEVLEKKYPIPKNIPYLRAPLLNPKLESSLIDQSKKEDYIA